MFIRLDRVPACDRRTDRQTDRQTDRRNCCRYYSALHCMPCGRAVKTNSLTDSQCLSYTDTRFRSCLSNSRQTNKLIFILISVYMVCGNVYVHCVTTPFCGDRKVSKTRKHRHDDDDDNDDDVGGAR